MLSREEIHPNTRSKLPLPQLEAVSSRPVARFPGRKDLKWLNPAPRTSLTQQSRFFPDSTTSPKASAQHLQEGFESIVPQPCVPKWCLPAINPTSRWHFPVLDTGALDFTGWRLEHRSDGRDGRAAGGKGCPWLFVHVLALG